MRIFFITRESINGMGGSSIHLRDFLVKLGEINKLEIWVFQMNKGIHKFFKRCNCPRYLKINYTNGEFCIGGIIHLYSKNNKRSALIISFLKFIENPKNNNPLKYFKLVRNLTRLRNNYATPGFGQEATIQEKETFLEIKKVSKARIFGTNYSWMAKLIPKSSGLRFVFLHDLRFRNLDLWRSIFESIPPYWEKSEEIALLKSVDLVVTCNLIERELLINEGIQTANITLSQNAFSLSNRNLKYDKDRLPENLVYVASEATENVVSIMHFIETSWINLRKKFPQIQLFIIGGVGEFIKLDYTQQKGIHILGKVDSLEPFYRLADIAIVPHSVKGGIKIKLVEAICHGVPAIVSQAAAEGIPPVLAKFVEVSYEDWSVAFQKMYSVYHDRLTDLNNFLGETDTCLNKKAYIDFQEKISELDRNNQ